MKRASTTSYASYYDDLRDHPPSATRASGEHRESYATHISKISPRIWVTWSRCVRTFPTARSAISTEGDEREKEEKERNPFSHGARVVLFPDEKEPASRVRKDAALSVARFIGSLMDFKVPLSSSTVTHGQSILSFHLSLSPPLCCSPTELPVIGFARHRAASACKNSARDRNSLGLLKNLWASQQGRDWRIENRSNLPLLYIILRCGRTIYRIGVIATWSWYF